MLKILFVTVGGSFQPIVTAIQSLQPNRVVFIASDGEKGSKSQVVDTGTPCEVRKGAEIIERLPNIPTQVNLGANFQPDRDLILVQNPDNLAECYPKIRDYIQNLQKDLQKEHEHEIMADYTGGTKTLSGASSFGRNTKTSGRREISILISNIVSYNTHHKYYKTTSNLI